MENRLIIVCQVHGWIGTTNDPEIAADLKQIHLTDEHPPEFDGEILIAKELK